VMPAYGKEDKPQGKGNFVKNSYMDVIIYGGPDTAQGRGAGTAAVKQLSAKAAIKALEPDADVLEEYRSIGGVHAHIPVNALEKLRAQGYKVEENGVAYLQLDSSRPVINADKAMQSYLNGNGTKICILDTGIDFLHTQLKMPASNHVADFIKRADGPDPPGANGTLNRYNVYVNQQFQQLNWSINWGNTGNRFDMYVWYPNGTYAGGTNNSNPYIAYSSIAGGYYWWLNVTLYNAPAGLYNITVNNTLVANPTGEFFSVFWDPNNTQLGIAMSDIHGHGTHVAGIVAGNSSTYPGIAQGADIYIGRVCSANGIDGTCGDSDMLAGMQWCIDNGADIFSFSVGDTATANCNGAMDVLADKMADTVLPVIANGNSGSGAGTVLSPACARKVIGVGNVYDSGSIRADSSRGPTGDGRIKPDVAAPGDSVISACPINTFCSKGGTSMATPHVSAAAAIAKQANPAWTVPVLKAALMATANKTQGGNSLDNDYGAGLVDAMQMVTKPYANATSVFRGEPFAAYGRWLAAENNYTVQSIANETSFTMNITVPPGALSLKSVLYWEENSTDSHSQLHLHLFNPAGGWAGNSTLHKSNVQMVYNDTLTPGQWTLNVSGVNVTGIETFVLFTSLKISQSTYAIAELNITGIPQNFTAVPDSDRANYTNVTGNDWFVGPHSIRFYSNDTANNWGGSETATIAMYGWAGVNESTKPASVDEDTNFTAACMVRDQNTTAPIQGYSVSFWINDSYIASSDTNSTGWANITLSISEPATIALKCNITDSQTLYYFSDGTNNQTTITVNDTEKPQYSNLKNTSAVYGLDWQGNATWTDNGYLSYILFESNFTGAVLQYFPSISGSEFYFTIAAGNFTGGQVVKWRWVANDTANNTNYTDWQYFTVSKAPISVKLFLNGTEGNRSYARGSIANLTATINVSGKRVILAANFSNFAVFENSTDRATNITNTTGLGISEYNITAYFAADQNHTAAGATYFLRLLKPNGENCSAGSDCYSGTCCNGACADGCGNMGPSGGDGGAAAMTALLRVYSDLTERFRYESEYRITEFPAGSAVYYFFAGENHTITAVAIANTTVTLMIASSPYNITLSVGDTRKVDLNNDGTEDLLITLNGIKDGKADITFAKPAAVPPEKTENATQPAENTAEENPQEQQAAGRPVFDALFAVFGTAAAVFAVIKLRKTR
ncbi:MAG: S8 family serine peptidase, partial [Candidatus Aenigmatarchaeota archaeon]